MHILVFPLVSIVSWDTTPEPGAIPFVTLSNNMYIFITELMHSVYMGNICAVKRQVYRKIWDKTQIAHATIQFQQPITKYLAALPNPQSSNLDDKQRFAADNQCLAFVISWY